MRLFVAIELNAEVAAAATALTDELRRRCIHLAPRARITWVPAARMHLTLRFIGEADADQTLAIERVLEDPFAVDPFDLAFARAGAFPEAGPPRVFWAGLRDGTEALDRLHRLVSAGLESIGIAPDDKRFRPHLTLGRVRDAAGLRTRQLLDGLADVELGQVRIAETVLFESRQTARGPEYITRRRTRLGGG